MRVLKRRGLSGALVALAMVSSVAVAAQGSASAASSPQKFGTLASPCGPGSATGATDQGVTNKTISIGYGDDAGYSGQPGLDQEMGDAVKAMIAWCNAQGGINGRHIVGTYDDAAVLNVNQVMAQACKSEFMMVGQGFALDELAEQTRLGCNLVQVPGFTVGPDVANSYETYQAVPNPVNNSPVSAAYQLPEVVGKAPTQSASVLLTSLSTQAESTLKAVQAYTEAGWNFVNCPFTVNYAGEPNYTPFAQKLQSCGAKVVFTNSGPGPVFYGMLQADSQLNYNPIWMGESNVYSEQFAAWNTSGLGNNVYVRMAFEPLEAAKVVPAVADYLSIVKKSGGQVSLLGEQATSSFLLWATEAKACGSTLTRQCMINKLATVTSWTGGGLNVPTNPSKNLPPHCGLLLKLNGTKWVQVYPKTLGTFQCATKFVVPNSGPGAPGHAERPGLLDQVRHPFDHLPSDLGKLGEHHHHHQELSGPGRAVGPAAGPREGAAARAADGLGGGCPGGPGSVTVRPVMVSTTLTVGAGRPRDPRIDEAVVAAVVELLCEVGYQRLSIAAVAARAGTTKPAIYRRWPTKAQLVHEAVFPAEGRPLVPETDDLAADLRSMLTDGIALFSRPEVRAAAPGLLADLAQDPGAHPRLLARFTSPMFDQLQGRLERAAAAHQVRPDVDARLLVDVIGGSTFMAVLTRDRAELEGPWVDQTLALLLAGVQA